MCVSSKIYLTELFSHSVLELSRGRGAKWRMSFGSSFLKTGAAWEHFSHPLLNDILRQSWNRNNSFGSKLVPKPLTWDYSLQIKTKRKEKDPIKEIETICKRYIPNIDGDNHGLSSSHKSWCARIFASMLLRVTRSADSAASSFADRHSLSLHAIVVNCSVLKLIWRTLWDVLYWT